MFSHLSTSIFVNVDRRPGKGATTGPTLCLEDKATGRNLAHHALALCKGREATEAHAQQGLAARENRWSMDWFKGKSTENHGFYSFYH